MACGRYRDAIPELRPLLADQPLKEELWLLLLRALDGAGRCAQALAAYDQARAVLSDQLGVDPGPELRDLFRRLLQEEPLDPATSVPPAASAQAEAARTTLEPGAVATPPPAPASQRRGPDRAETGDRGREPGRPRRVTDRATRCPTAPGCPAPSPGPDRNRGDGGRSPG